MLSESVELPWSAIREIRLVPEENVWDNTLQIWGRTPDWDAACTVFMGAEATSRSLAQSRQDSTF